MDLSRIVHGMAPHEAPAPQTTPNATAQNSTTPQESTAAPADLDKPMPDATVAAQNPTHQKARESSSESFDIVSKPSEPHDPVSQASIPSPEEQPPEEYPQETTSEEDESPLGPDATVSKVTQSLETAISKLGELPEHEQTFVMNALLKKNPGLQKKIKELGERMNSMTLGPGSPKKRKQECSEFAPSEDDPESAPASPTKIRSKKGNSRGGSRNSRLSASQNSNLGDIDTPMNYEEFCMVCKLHDVDNDEEELDPTVVSNMKAAYEFCNKLLQGDFCSKVEEFAKEVKGFANKRTRNSWSFPPFEATEFSISNDHDRTMAILELRDRIQNYPKGRTQASKFFQIWENVSVVDLAEPYWKKPGGGGENQKPTSRQVWQDWKNIWNKELRKEGLPTIDEAIARGWYHDLEEGLYWQEWCRLLSDNDSGFNHRGALLLLGPSGELNNQQLSIAKACLETAVPWAREAAEMLDSWAILLYTDANNIENFDDLNRSLVQIKRGMQRKTA